MQLQCIKFEIQGWGKVKTQATEIIIDRRKNDVIDGVRKVERKMTLEENKLFGIWMVLIIKQKFPIIKQINFIKITLKVKQLSCDLILMFIFIM